MNVPESVRRMACGTALMSYEGLPSFSVRPTLAPFIWICLNFSEITIWPLYVGCSGLPDEIGMVLIVLPSRTTVICFVFASTVLIWLRPILNVTVFWMPWRLSVTVAVEPGFQ